MEDGLLQSKNVQNVIKIFLLISIAAAIYYFSFLFNPANIGNTYLYLILIFAEIYIFIQSVGTWYTLLHSGEKHLDDKYINLKQKLIKTGKMDGGVAVFVTAAGEPLELLEPTLRAAVKMRVKHTVYLLDDLGKEYSDANDPYKALAEKLKVKYIKTKDNYLYKVGALNYGIAHVKEKYFANFDGDFIPQENFLIETLPYFWDTKLAWVQTPQKFRDLNNLLSKGSGESTEAFYQYVMPSKNAFNAALFVGTNATWRKEALESIGGFQYHHSEDVYTAYKIHDAGWKSIAIPTALAYGICPDDTTTLFKQSLRWSGGSLEIFLYENLLKSKLSLDQKMQYFTTFSFYLFGLVILAMLLMPIVYLISGAKPLVSFSNSWALHYIPYFIFQFSTIALFASKLSMPAIIVSMSQFPIYVRGFINALRRKHSKWTISNALKTGGYNPLVTVNNLYWHFLIILISVLALLIGAINIREKLTFIISSFWVIFNSFLLFLFIKGAFKADKQSAESRK